MALSDTVLRNHVLITSVLIFTSLFCTVSGEAEEYHEPEYHEPEYHEPKYHEPEYHEPEYHEPEIGTGTGTATNTGTASHDPAQIVAKALLCFNDKYIYSSCEESYRLTASGKIDVPHDMIDTYCGGPCLTETHLVLDCIDNILANFLFYNKATIQDVRDTIHAACGYGPERGNFNVAEHIQAEEDNAKKLKVTNQIVVVLGLMVIGHGLL